MNDMLPHYHQFSSCFIIIILVFEESPKKLFLGDGGKIIKVCTKESLSKREMGDKYFPSV
jgi:hypothetical protein